jgi:16S rRNA (cytosine1402-N4)-methyltransferase
VQRLDEMTFVANPVDQMANVCAIGARAVTTSAICLEGMDSSSAYHAPVLANEVTELLRESSAVLDGTLGGGGHSKALLERGVQRVIGIDRDPEALTRRRIGSRISRRPDVFEPSSRTTPTSRDSGARHARFDGILLDLGVSSHKWTQEDVASRFGLALPLDMRMGRDSGTDARGLLNTEDEMTLGGIFKNYGDEPRGARLAKEVVRRRRIVLRRQATISSARSGRCSEREADREISRVYFKRFASP